MITQLLVAEKGTSSLPKYAGSVVLYKDILNVLCSQVKISPYVSLV